MINFIKNMFKKDEEDIDLSSSLIQQELKIQAEETVQLAKEISYHLQTEINDIDKKLVSVCDLLQDQLLIVDIDGIIQFVNLRAKSYFLHDIIGEKIENVLMVDNINDIDQLYKSTKIKNKLHYYSVEIDNIHYKMDISMSYISFLDKKDVYVVLLDNITERIDYEQELLESNEKFQIFSELTNDGMAIVYDNKILSYNSRFLVMTEYVISDLLNLNFNELFNTLPIDSTLLRHENILTTKFGKKTNISINKNQIIWNDLKVDIFVLRDITRFKINERKLTDKADRFSELLDNSYISICCFDSNFNITYVNEIFLKEYNLLPNQVISSSIFDFLPEKDKNQFSEDLGNINYENQSFRSLHYYNNKYKDWICYGKFNQNNAVEEYQCSIRDITRYFKNS